MPQHDLKHLTWSYLDGARLAKREGLLANLVTNGSMTPEALERENLSDGAFGLSLERLWMVGGVGVMPVAGCGVRESHYSNKE